MSVTIDHSLEHEAIAGDEKAIAILTFRGVAGVGSEGNGNALYVIQTIKETVSRNQPRALVVDFRRLEYEFGNMMMKAMALKDDWGLEYLPENMPTARVLSILPPVSNPSWIRRLFCRAELKEGNDFADMESAINYLKGVLEPPVSS